MEIEPGDSGQFLPVGAVVGRRYKVVRPLGSGGMASVYLAEDMVLGETTVAIKVLRRTNKFKDEILQRFLREVRLTHKINHENVVRTFDFGQDGDTLFYTMEYLPGATLDSLLEASSVSLDVALSVAIQLMRGISAVHAVGVVHRDLKPANIMILPGGRLKIADFGIARAGASMLTVSSGEIVGTICYLAPEMLMGSESTAAVDYYAVGVILYQLLTKCLPIDDEVPARLIMRKVEEVPRDPRDYRPDIPNWVADGIMGLLSVDPHLRMQALTDFARDLDTYGPKNVSKSLSSNVAPDTLSIDQVLVDQPGKIGSVLRGHNSSRLTKGVLSVLAGLLTLPILLTDASSMIEFAHFDNLFSLRGDRPARPDVVIVSIDEPSYSALNVPLNDMWPRALHTKLLNRLSEDGAKRAVFDVLFAEPSGNVEGDNALAEAMGRVPTVLGAVTGFTHQTTLNGSYMLEELIKPAPIFAAKASSLGVTGLPIEYGRVRSVLPPRSELFSEVPSLAQAASGVVDQSQLPDGRALLNFYGPSRAISTVPYYMTVSDDHPLPKGYFSNKIVFVGLNLKSRTGPSQRESFVTPFDQTTYGTEIHATAASNLLSRDWISRLKPRFELALGFCVAACVAAVLLQASGAMLMAWLLGALGFVFASQYLVFLLGWAVPVVSAVGFGLFCGLLFRIMLTTPGYGRWR